MYRPTVLPRESMWSTDLLKWSWRPYLV